MLTWDDVDWLICQAAALARERQAREAAERDEIRDEKDADEWVIVKNQSRRIERLETALRGVNRLANLLWPQGHAITNLCDTALTGEPLLARATAEPPPADTDTRGA
jgi:hypothetical protein